MTFEPKLCWTQCFSGVPSAPGGVAGTQQPPFTVAPTGSEGSCAPLTGLVLESGGSQVGASFHGRERAGHPPGPSGGESLTPASEGEREAGEDTDVVSLTASHGAWFLDIKDRTQKTTGFTSTFPRKNHVLIRGLRYVSPPVRGQRNDGPDGLCSRQVQRPPPAAWVCEGHTVRKRAKCRFLFRSLSRPLGDRLGAGQYLVPVGLCPRCHAPHGRHRAGPVV